MQASNQNMPPAEAKKPQQPPLDGRPNQSRSTGAIEGKAAYLFYRAALFSIVILLGAFYCLYNVDRQSIVRQSDELIHVQVVQEMVHDGHVLLPTWYGTPYLNKPPLKLWLSAALVWTFGESNQTYRLVDGFSGIGILVLTYLLCLRIFDSPLGGVLAAATLCGARHFISGGHGVRQATQDPFMLLLCTGALLIGFELVRFYRGDIVLRRPERLLHYGFGLLVGAAVLTKSVAGAVPYLIVILYLLFDRKALRGALLRKRLWLETILLGAAPVVLYAAYHLLFHHDQFLLTARVEVLDRAISGFHNRQREYFYWRELFLRDSIATPIILAASLLYAGYRAAADHRFRYLLCWAVLPIILYSGARSRMVWYILIAYPGLSAAVGLFTAELFRRKEFFRLALVFGVLAAGQLTYRMYRIGRHVVAERQVQIDRFVEQLRKNGASPRAIVGNPFHLDPVLVNNLGRLDLIYVRMLEAAPISAGEAMNTGWKTVLCAPDDCSEIIKVRGQPLKSLELPAKSVRPDPVLALIY